PDRPGRDLLGDAQAPGRRHRDADLPGGEPRTEPHGAAAAPRAAVRRDPRVVRAAPVSAPEASERAPAQRGAESGSRRGAGVHRLTSRVLLFDRESRILLFLTKAPDTSGLARWITPGGGVDPG